MNQGKQLARSQIIFLSTLAFCVYYLIIRVVETQPFSDFEYYYATALLVLEGKGISNFHKYFQGPGYPYLLALVFHLMMNHSVFLIQLLNVIILTFLLRNYLQYSLVSSSRLLIIGFFILAFNLNNLAMVGVLCSEIPYVLFLSLGFLAFGRGLIKTLTESGKGKSPIPSYVISGLFWGISQFIRPVTVPLLFLLAFFSILGIRFFEIAGIKRDYRSIFLFSIKSMGTSLGIFFFSALVLYGVSGYGLTYMPLQKGLWNIYVGFNIESKGFWNTRDMEMIVDLGKKYQWSASEINGKLKPAVYARAKDNWVLTLQIFPGKMVSFLNPKSLPFWAIEKSKIGDKNIVYEIAGLFSYLNFAVLILSLAAWTVCIVRRKLSKAEFIFFCLISTACSYMVIHGYLFEVQARYSYHLWIILFWCFPICLEIIIGAFQKRQRSR